MIHNFPIITVTTNLSIFFQNSCDSKGNKCQCDQVDTNSQQQQWNYDEGHLTNKNQLPVTKINFGGLGQPSLRPREAKFELGPLYCSGADPGDQNYAVRNHGASPASCKDLWLRGHHDVSFFL